MYKTYAELSTTCHQFDYRHLVIAGFQKAVSSIPANPETSGNRDKWEEIYKN